MEETYTPGSRPGYELDPEEVQQLSLTEAEEKMLYLRYIVIRETQEANRIRYQYLIDLLETRISLLQQGSGGSIPAGEEPVAGFPQK